MFKTTRRTRAKDIIPRVWPNTDASGATIEVHGLLCASPEALFAQMAKELPLEDLIEFGDSLVCRDPARRRTTLAELRKFIHSCDSFQGQKTMHQGTHPDSREHRLPGRDPLAPAAQTVWIPRANHQRPGRGDGQCRARSRNFGRPAADPIWLRCRSARALRQHTVLSPSRARPRCGGNRCRLRGRWARRRDRGDRRRSGCRS
jgi:hypothetical protein